MTSHIRKKLTDKQQDKQQDKEQDKEQHIKRPINSFMLWTLEHRRQLCNENSSLNNAEISTLLGQTWNALSNEAKQTYKDKADQVKQEHKRKYPDYIYRPKHKLGTIPTFKTTTFTHTPYMPLTINITNPNQTHSFTKKENKDKTNAPTYNSKMNLTINFNDNWLTYKEGYNYYEDIELFYSKL